MTIPAGIAGYFSALFAGMFSYLAMESFCPNDKWVSEMCVADYMNVVDKITFTAFPAIAAILVVLLPSFVAPRHKFYTAAAAFVVGCATAVYMAFAIHAWTPLASSVIAGVLGVFWVYRKYGVEPQGRKCGEH